MMERKREGGYMKERLYDMKDRRTITYEGKKEGGSLYEGKTICRKDYMQEELYAGTTICRNDYMKGRRREGGVPWVHIQRICARDR